MSNQETALTLTPLARQACCAPLTASALTAEVAAELAPAFKAIGGPVRLRLLSMIASARDKADTGGRGELCVCDITPAFDLSGPTISHHLKVLREAGLVDCERRGTWVYYWVIPDKLAALSRLLDIPAGVRPAGVRRECP